MTTRFALAALAALLCPLPLAAGQAPSGDAVAAVTSAAPSARQRLGGTGLLLVPDSSNDRIMAFDPFDGALLDANFVPPDPARVGIGVHAILSHDRSRILLSDETGHAIHAYDLGGAYRGTFVGGDPFVFAAPRGLALHEDGRVLATVAANANANSVLGFDRSGFSADAFIAKDSGGLAGPVAIHRRELDWLVSGAGSQAVHRYGLFGEPLTNLLSLQAPQQIADSASGGLLIANAGGPLEGIVELDAEDRVIAVHRATGVAGYRGVYELGNGNLLVSGPNGVHEISRGGALVDSKITGVSAQLIQFVPPGPTLHCSTAPITIPDHGPASAYPSVLFVSGQPPSLRRVVVHLRGLSHSWPPDLDLLLVAPGGQATIVMSDTGDPTTVVELDLVLDERAALPLPLWERLRSGRFRPTNHDAGDSFPAPAPAPGTDPLAALAGSDPNGVWQLYLVDDSPSDAGSLREWCVEIDAGDAGLTPARLDVAHLRPSTSQHVVILVNQGHRPLTWHSDEASATPTKRYAWPIDPLFNNGPLVTHAGTALDGADESVVQNVSLGLTTLGTAVNGPRYRLADDVDVPAPGWLVDRITVFSYQTGSDLESSFTAGHLRVWDGPPWSSGSRVVWGDRSSNRLFESEWSGIYRRAESNPGNTQRPIMAVTLQTPGLMLAPGRWWLDWQLAGALGSGSWAPPITILGEVTTGDAHQLSPFSPQAGWTPLHDGGLDTPQGLPFVIERGTRCNSPQPVDWLSSTPSSGSVAAGDSVAITVTVSSTGTASGDATLCLRTDDPSAPLIELPITVTHRRVFVDGFE
jgi:hypothetical protein